MERYLIVDDEEMGRYMLQAFLSEFALCDVAENGNEALRLFEKAQLEGKPYDLLCVDLIMPGMNGIALIRKIRELERIDSVYVGVRSKIFVITASDSAWDKADLLLENLCDDYIVKPFNRESLKDDLYKHELGVPGRN